MDCPSSSSPSSPSSPTSSSSPSSPSSPSSNGWLSECGCSWRLWGQSVKTISYTGRQEELCFAKMMMVTVFIFSILILLADLHNMFSSSHLNIFPIFPFIAHNCQHNEQHKNLFTCSLFCWTAYCQYLQQ